MSVILEAKGLGVDINLKSGLFTSKQSIPAVRSVSFKVARGETFGLVGESGSGKTTTARALARLIPHTRGTVTIDGMEFGASEKMTPKKFRRSVQMVFQDPYSSLNPSMTIGTILAEPLVVHGIGDARSRAAAVAEVLDQVGLNASVAERHPHEFSGGQRQRIAIARALISKPSLMICDEPVSALDLSTQGQIVNLLKDIQRDHGMSYVVIGHDLAIMKHLCDTIAVMYLGELVEYGPTERLYAAPMHPYTRALLSGARLLDEPKDRQPKLTSDEVPSPLNPPSGCKFRTRCPKAFALCAEKAPPVVAHPEGGWAACHLYSEPGSATAGSNSNAEVISK